MHIDELLIQAVERKASDIHITVGAAPMMRVNGDLLPIIPDIINVQRTQELVYQLMTDDQREKFENIGEIDFSYGVPRIGRFRVNVFKQRGTPGAALRAIPSDPPGFDSLGIPAVVKSFARKTRGLVLVTGPTGNGKSTTLASLLDLINTERKCHIVTLEDPIEYLHKHRNSVVVQREIGFDSKSFANALRAALRQDPDVILLGEMRDLETISTAITAAETGHLVLATLHTSDAMQTIERIIDVFPPFQQQQVRVQLANILQGVVSQQLLPKKDGSGRVVATEVLVATWAIRNLIREGKTHQISSHLQTGGKYGMQTMDDCLKGLYQQGLVSMEEALSRAIDPESFRKSLGELL